MAQNTVATADAQMFKTLEDFRDSPDPDDVALSVEDGQVRLTLAYDQPGVPDFELEAKIETRTVNQFARFESYKNGECGNTHERYTATRVYVLFRDGNEWHYGEPLTPPATHDKARYPQSELDPDGHLPTTVDGITRNQVKSISNRRDVFKKARLKVTREFVESVDEAYVLEWDVKHESGRNGSYTSKSNATAYQLEVED